MPGELCDLGTGLPRSLRFGTYSKEMVTSTSWGNPDEMAAYLKALTSTWHIQHSADSVLMS